MTTEPPAPARSGWVTILIALIFSAVLALRGVELGWPLGLTLLLVASLSLLALVPANAIVRRARSRRRIAV